MANNIPIWYTENEIKHWLQREYPGLEGCAAFVAKHLQNAYVKGYEHGFTEGEAKQAILEIRGRDRFLQELKQSTPTPSGIRP